MGQRITSERSEGLPCKYKFEGQEVNARDHGFKMVMFEPRPFSAGKFRCAYKGKVIVDEGKEGALAPTRTPFLNCWQRSLDRKDGKPYFRCVVKIFKRSHAKQVAEWSKDLSVLTKAQDLAERFNKRVSPTVKVDFAGAFLYDVSKPGAAYEEGCWPWSRRRELRNENTDVLEKRDKVCVEPLLQGDFVKANCNNGYVGNVEDSYFNDTAQAFSHWTWAETNGDLLVCDLQGVQKKAANSLAWQFTDPAIHDAAGKQRFGVTDLGPRGINAFFRTHTCNSICQGMRKPHVLVDVGMNPLHCRSGRTTFSFELARVSTEVHDQQDFADILDHAHKGTCYAQSVATILRAAERRIVGRTPEKHHVIASRIVAIQGTKGGSAELALEEECPRKCLRWRRVDAQDAPQCLQLGRAILCSFWLSDEQWSSFSAFFRTSPSAVLDELPGASKDVVSGHACVLIGQDDKTWKAKNSWGDEFADGGYFNLSKELFKKIHARFFDVFFVESDLKPEDRQAFVDYCRNSNLHSM